MIKMPLKAKLKIKMMLKGFFIFSQWFFFIIIMSDHEQFNL